MLAALSGGVATVRCIFAFNVDLLEGDVCPPHSHETTELVLSIGCAGLLHQNHCETRYYDRTIIVYQPGLPHWIRNEASGRQLCIGTTGLGIGSIAPGVYPANDALLDLFDRIGKTAHRLCRHDETRLDLLTGLVTLELIEQLKEPRCERTRAERVKDILDTQFATEWDIASLAREVYVSPDYLRQLFRTEYGEPVIHYLIRRRIDYAKTLLRETNDSIADIAEAAGFHDPCYFSRMFKKHTGVAPTGYRSYA